MALADSAASAPARLTLSFYRYVRVSDPVATCERLREGLTSLDALGRIYVAEEGVNAQLSLPEQSLSALADYLAVEHGWANLRLNVGHEHETNSFRKLIVRVRPKIVADGLDDATFDASAGGEHLDADRFDALAQDPTSVVVDMRNHYESEVGYFEGAIRPQVDTFRESLPIVEDLLAAHREAPVLLYCTGGIRCEKASAWLRHRGFEQVYQLEGGIIHYAHERARQGQPGRFVGKNFVFDDRLGERIGPEVVSRCHQCGVPSDRHVNCVNDRCHLLFLQCEACAERFEDCCSQLCRDYVAEKRAGTLDEDAALPVFNGSRYPHAHYRANDEDTMLS